MFLGLLSRNVHHTRHGDKNVYILPWPYRLFFMGCSLLFLGFAAYLVFDPAATVTLDWPTYMGIGFMAIPFSLLSWYFVLYRVSTDDKAIYFAAFLTTMVPFGSITRVVQKQGRNSRFSYIYSKGHLPMYITGFLPDYDDLMGAIRDKAPQAAWET